MNKNPDCLHRDSVYRHRAFVWVPANKRHKVDMIPSEVFGQVIVVICLPKTSQYRIFAMHLLIGHSCISGVMWGTN